jgi:biotin carboxylase
VTGARPALLLIGSGERVWREYMLRSMASRYRLHLFSPRPATWETDYVEGCTVLDTLDVAAMVAAARDRPETFAGSLTYEETRVESAALLAATLGHRSSPPAAVRACRDKYAGRQALHRAGVPQARSVAVADLAAAERAARDIGYPVVVKPRALSASNGVTLVPGPDRLASAFAEATRIWFDAVPRYDEAVLIEEFLAGPEISVESVCRDGRVTALFVAHKTLGYPPGFESLAHLVDGADPLLHDPDLLGVVQSAHTALGLTDSVTHTELVLTPAGPRVVEINARVGGDRTAYLGGLATGRDASLIAADLAAGAVPDTSATTTAVAGVRFLYPDHDLRVTGIDVDTSRLPAETCDVRVLAEPGSDLRLPPEDHVYSRYALIAAVAATEKRCVAALDEAAAAVTVRGTPLPARGEAA